MIVLEMIEMIHYYDLLALNLGLVRRD